ncbi:hypothetical protein EV2_019635 [Malus domestica]
MTTSTFKSTTKRTQIGATINFYVNPAFIPVFLSCIQSTDASDKSLTHGDPLSPHLTKMLNSITKRLSDPNPQIGSAICLTSEINVTHLAAQISAEDGPVPNGDFELTPSGDFSNEGMVDGPAGIPNWKANGTVELVEFGQKQGGMILIVPQGRHAVKLENDAEISQQVKVEKWSIYLDPYAWAFEAEEDNAILVFRNPSMEDDPTCGPIIDDVAIKKLFTPDRPKSMNHPSKTALFFNPIGPYHRIRVVGACLMTFKAHVLVIRLPRHDRDFLLPLTVLQFSAIRSLPSLSQNLQLGRTRLGKMGQRAWQALLDRSGVFIVEGDTESKTTLQTTEALCHSFPLVHGFQIFSIVFKEPWRPSASFLAKFSVFSAAKIDNSAHSCTSSFNFELHILGRRDFGVSLRTKRLIGI